MYDELAVLALIIVMLVVPWMMAPGRGTRFTSDQERRLWFWALAVLVVILGTIGPAQMMAEVLREHNLLRISAALVLLLLGVPLALRWAMKRPGRREIGAAMGVAAVYVMALLRIGSLEERTHLFEYGLVAILIYQALSERQRNGQRVPAPAALAVIATALLGWLDEGIQALLPNRVYDIRDVGFNALAGLMAIAASLVMARARRANTQ